MNYGQLVFRFPGYIGFGALHYFFSSLGQTFLISLFVPHFRENIGISNADFSLLYAVATISSATILPFIGGYIDKVKIRYASLANGLAIAFFALIISFSNNFIILFLGVLGVRFCGQGLMILIGSTAIARYFTYDRGKALSLSGLGLSLAEASLPVLISGFIGWLSWEAAWQLLSFMAIAVFVPSSLFLVKKDNPFQFAKKQKLNRDQFNATRKDVIKDPIFYMLLPAFLFLPFFITGVFIHQNLLAESKGWSMEWMATTFIGFGIIRILTSIIAGPLVDKFTAKKVFIFYLVPLLIGIGFLLMGNHPIFALLYMVFIGITASLSSLTSTAMWAELYGVHHLGAIKSMITTMMVLSTAVGPVVIGSALENPANTKLFLIFSGLIILIFTFISFLAVSKSNHRKKN